MKVKVLQGFVSYERKLYGAGEIVTVDDTIAQCMLSDGRAEAVSISQPSNVKEPTHEETMELPKVSETTVVKRSRSKK